MKSLFKQTALITLAAAMAANILAGCGDLSTEGEPEETETSSDISTAEVIFTSDSEITLDTVIPEICSDIPADTLIVDTSKSMDDVTEIDVNMPDPFYNAPESDVYMLGHELFFYPTPNVRKLDDFSNGAIEHVGKDTFNEWCDDDSLSIYNVPDNLLDFHNLYSYLYTFEISFGYAYNALSPLAEEGDEVDLTLREFEIMYSGDTELVAQTFATEYAIVKGSNLYSPYWVYMHTIESYEAVGITPEDILERVELYSNFNFLDEAREMFEAKLSEFTGTEISLEWTHLAM